LLLLGLVMLMDKSRVLGPSERLELGVGSGRLREFGLEVRGAQFTLGDKLEHKHSLVLLYVYCRFSD
jgi:hypothetical protein